MRRDVFQAIADPTRRAILVLLTSQAMAPNAIAEEFSMSRQAVSKHIQMLAECELVTHYQSGREIYYQLDPAKMKEVSDWLAPFQRMWEARLDNFDNYVQKLKNKRRKK